ncbi:SCO family protein [Pseudomonadota bacterium]
MTKQKIKVPKAVYLIVAAILILATLSQIVILKYGNFKRNSQNMDDGIAATILYDPSPITSFRLTDHNGNAFNQDNLTGKWSILTFGYTHCPDICPTTLNILNQVDKLLKESNNANQPQFVFVSLDPERDSVAQLAEYIPWFNKEFIGLTGTKEQVEVLTKVLGILNQKREVEGDGNYQIDHTVTVMIVDTKAQLRALSSAPHDAQTLANDFVEITRKYN